MRSSNRRVRSDRGAVLVEYALVLTLLLVGSLGVIELLGEKSDEEVNRQADCISTRPPPPGCQPRSVTTLPPTSIPPTSVVTTAPPPEVTATATFVNGRIEDQVDGIWDAVIEVLFETDAEPASPYGGATVRARVTIVAPSNPNPFFIDCLTEADGTCELRFTTPAPGITELRIEYETTDGFVGTVTAAGLPLTFMHT